MCDRVVPPQVKQVLPELLEMLPEDGGDGGDGGDDGRLPAEVTADLCHILNNLSQSDKQHVRTIVSEGALRRIIAISTSGGSARGERRPAFLLLLFF